MKNLKRLLAGVVVLGVVGCGAITFTPPTQPATATHIKMKSGSLTYTIPITSVKSITITLSDAPTSPVVIRDAATLATVCTELNLDEPAEPEALPSGTVTGEVVIEAASFPLRTMKIFGTTKVSDWVETEVVYTPTVTIDRAWLDALID